MNAETAPRHDFEEEQMRHFDGCLPVEVIAKRGEQTLLFGPLRPVGFEAANAGETPYAVVQLRQDNTEGTLFNIVGFQTNLKWGEQEARLPPHTGAEERGVRAQGALCTGTSSYARRACSTAFCASKGAMRST